ncbi:uncharacterized protein N7482_004098 [Penicillium canariense]|uniref:UspA domain-containing protein n=1 Tax=Penicillium canariense TaxID=189055 RepID=A0A9W9LP21_9EURO|nr:uncharacterized protein N7482_004098 [Penicillium canariense]KAJ5168504.1 hypothetical protein N7482_004098 [Penicillium canariense]
MSYQTGRISPISSSQTPAEDTNIRVPGRRFSLQSSNTSFQEDGLPGLPRAVRNLLSPPQSARSPGARARRPSLLSGRGVQSPLEPIASSPLRTASSTMASAPSSPERPQANAEDGQRISSHQSTRDDRRFSTGRVAGIDEDAKSDISTISAEQTGSKKKTQGRKAMAAMMSGLESRLFPKSFSRGRDSSRGSSRRGSSLDSRSHSSASRLSRSVSPGHRMFESESQPTTPSAEKGQALKMEDAHNKSDEALSKPSGGLPDYVKPTEQEESGERLAKDVFDRDKNIIESSEEDGDEESSEDEQVPGVTVVSVERGRKPRVDDISRITSSDFNKPKDTKFSITDEQKPTLKHNIPAMGKKPRKSALKSVVHPQTSFDIPTPYAHSAAGTPYGSEDEAEKADVHRAQQLSISMSTIDNRVPNRSIRTIVRGDFASLQEEADGGRRRQRKYLVATDLSEESVYALEWTVGAILREGDTMYAIYAMHEDASTSSVQVGEGAKAMQDAAVVVGSQTKEASRAHGTSSRNLLGRLGPGTASKASSVDSRMMSPAAEEERVSAVEAVSSTCVKLLRKTLLQVRIAVEVIHCKSPKLMITEAIDELEPTLVIVGARGQSALKGVLLGSFSNYLLSNSSVPVMVARRKLKRHPSKGKANVRLSNNLPTPKSLTQAKVD